MRIKFPFKWIIVLSLAVIITIGIMINSYVSTTTIPTGLDDYLPTNLPDKLQILSDYGVIIESAELLEPFPFPEPRPVPDIPDPLDFIVPFHVFYPFFDYQYMPRPVQLDFSCNTRVSEDGLGFVFTSHPALGHVKLNSLNGEILDNEVFIRTAEVTSLISAQTAFGPFTFDLKGNLLIVDPTSNEVYSYDFAGTKTSPNAFIPRTLNDGLDNITSLKIGPDQMLYIASANSNEIKKFHSTTGAFLNNFIDTNLDEPIDFEFDQDGQIFVLNGGVSKNVMMFNQDGDPGSSEILLTLANDDEPYDIIVHDNYLLVSVSDRIEKYSLTYSPGGLVVSAPTVLISDNTISLNGPIYMSMGPENNVYITDYQQKQIRIINSVTGVQMGSFRVGYYSDANPFYIQIGTMPEVPFHNVDVPIHPSDGSGISSYRAYQCPDDNFQIVCEESCSSIDVENLYANYWGFKKAHSRTVGFFGGADVSNTYSPVDIHLFDDSWCANISGIPISIYSGHYIGVETRGYTCTYAGEFHRFYDIDFHDYIPQNQINVDHQLLLSHEYGHNILRDLLPSYTIQEDLVKYASHAVAGGYTPLWSDPCHEQHNTEHFGKIIYELCQQNGLTLNDLAGSMHRLAQMREESGESTTVADWVLILNEVLGSDTRQAFLDVGIPESLLP